MKRDLLPLRMERRLRECREFTEKRIDEPGEPEIALGFGRPSIGREDRWGRDRTDAFTFLDEVWIIVRRKLCWQIVRLQRLGISDRNQVQILVLDRGGEF